MTVHHPGPLRIGRVHCLLSDCDGVIVDSEPVADRVMTDVLAQAFGRSDLGHRLRPLFGHRVRHIIAALEGELGQPLGTARRLELEARIDEAVAEAAPAMADVASVYGSLGLPVGIVSNSARGRLLRSVQQAGLLGLVGPHVYSADEVAHPKPAPDLYLHAAACMGFAPQRCLVIEDSVAGVLAARAAGMRVFGFLGGGHVPVGHDTSLLGAGAATVFHRLADLPRLLQHETGRRGRPDAARRHPRTTTVGRRQRPSRPRNAMTGHRVTVRLIDSS